MKGAKKVCKKDENQNTTVVRTSRGLSIAGTRITIYDVMDYLTDYWPPKLIQHWLNLTDKQITDVMDYIETHRAEVEAEYQTVLQYAEEIRQYWEERQVYKCRMDNDNPVYSIDTPPPTISGDLHMGHCYSYSQQDFYARFHRMNGRDVFYPMGYDDNGLPTERLVENRLGITPEGVGTEALIREIIKVSKQLYNKTMLSFYQSNKLKNIYYKYKEGD